MRFPNFLILGALKSGTTSLYSYLGQHPDVLFATPKEPLFFAQEYERGFEFYQQTCFPAVRHERAVGEACAVSLFLPFVPDRIKATLPEARFIVILRDPVQRAFSHWWMKQTLGAESLSFEDAVADNFRRLAAGKRFEGEEGAREWAAGHDPATMTNAARFYVDAGYYAKQLRNYYARFPRDRFKVVLFDDVQRNPEKLVRELWLFLGVDPEVPLRDLVPHNPAIPASLLGLFRLTGRLGLRQRLPPSVGWRLRNWAARLGSPPRIEVAIEDLLYEHYAPHNRALEELLACDLSCWAPR